MTITYGSAPDKFNMIYNETRFYFTSPGRYHFTHVCLPTKTNSSKIMVILGFFIPKMCFCAQHLPPPKKITKFGFKTISKFNRTLEMTSDAPKKYGKACYIKPCIARNMIYKIYRKYANDSAF